MTGTELTITDKTLLQAQRIHQATAKWNDQLSAADAASETLLMVRAIGELRSLMTEDVVREIDGLRGSTLGFLTDRDKTDKPPYGLDVIRDVWIKASLVGARMVDAEVMIFNSGIYLTQRFFRRKLLEIPGLSDLEESSTIPKQVSDRAVTLTVTVEFRLNGKPEKHAFPLNAKIDRIWSDEQVQGKAYRKAFAKLLQKLTSRRSLLPGDPDDATIIDAECTVVSQEDLREAGDDRQAEQDASKAHAAVEGEQWPEGGEELVAAFTARLKEAKTKEQLNAIWRLMSDAQNAKRFTVSQASGMWKLYQDKARAGE